MFSYIAASPFIFQEKLSLSPQQYSFVFASNAAMLTVASTASSRLVRSFSPKAIILFALSTMLATSAGLLIVALLGPSLWPA